jgi:APA family basic amino acid/polyamine antiporter
VFGRLSRRGTPVLGLVISSALATGLMALNFTATLVEQFTFIILLATLSTLVPYAFSAVAQLVLLRQEGRPTAGDFWKAALIPTLALLYSLWAMAGSGRTTVFWGAILLAAGVPVYLRQMAHQSRPR